MAKKIATSVDMLGNKITGLPAATQPSDAVRFDQLGTSLLAEAEVILPEIVVRAVSTANLASLVGPQTVDGIVLAAGDYVLLKNQTTTSQNGVWKVAATSVAWTRATGYDSDDEIRQREVMCSGDGTTNKAGYRWKCSNTSAVTPGTTALTYVQIPNGIGTGALNAAAGNHTHTGIPTQEAEATQLNIEVKAVATSNITLSAPQTIDGVSLVAGDYCLVAGQTAPAQNGVYKVNAGAWTRATGYDIDSEIRKRIILVNTDGTSSRVGDRYCCNSGGVITPGTTPIYITRLPIMVGTTTPNELHTQALAVTGDIIDCGQNTVAIGYDTVGARASIVAGRSGVASKPLDIVASDVTIGAALTVYGACTLLQNDGVYCALKVDSIKNNYHGICLPGITRLNLMSSTQGGYAGLFNESDNKWLIYNNGAGASNAITQYTLEARGLMINGNYVQAPTTYNMRCTYNASSYTYMRVGWFKTQGSTWNGGTVKFVWNGRRHSGLVTMHVTTDSNGSPTVGSAKYRYWYTDVTTPNVYFIVIGQTVEVWITRNAQDDYGDMMELVVPSWMAYEFPNGNANSLSSYNAFTSSSY